MKEVDFRSRYAFIRGVYNLNIPGSGTASSLLSRILIPPANGKVIATNTYGYKLLLDPDNDRNGIEIQLYRRGFYEMGTLSIIGNFLTTGDTFADIGANIGVMSIFASRLVGNNGKVLSFEPHPETLEILRENLRLNHISNVTVHPFALGSTAGTAVIESSPIEGNRGSARINKDSQAATVNNFNIEIRQTDDAIQSNIHLAKIDVEGFEMEVLKGGKKLFSSPNAPALILECSVTRDNFNYTPGQMLEYIRSLNDYRIFALSRGMMRMGKLREIKDESDLPEHDNIFCFLPSQMDRIKKLL
jgi:FkbM family methyltransferase